MRIAGSSLRSGVRYTLRLTACMASSPTVCGFADTDVALRDQPLRGGIKGGARSAGQDDALLLDACHTGDPDVPSAQCDTSGNCGALRFVWACSRLIPNSGPSCPATPPSSSTCAWPIAGGVMPAGRFNVSVRVTNLLSPTLESIVSSVAVTVTPGVLPVISITELVAAKQ